ncbi:hypothetical protein Cni_G04450 [Canna indica]|uniref:Uncharacterized protein n=1 Tax=Canna indica TaxID=4628 RepID=A0AAQ3JUR4_9LILI|nr:hypothetical protein Cni_G04450 [Canna indica]
MNAGREKIRLQDGEACCEHAHRRAAAVDDRLHQQRMPNLRASRRRHADSAVERLPAVPNGELVVLRCRHLQSPGRARINASRSPHTGEELGVAVRVWELADDDGGADERGEGVQDAAEVR